MIQKVCSNPACHKTYEVSSSNHDDGFCSFDCWEQINCKEPQDAVFEDITVP